MPSHCLGCGQDFEGLYLWCPNCNCMCKSSASYGLMEMLSDAPYMRGAERPANFYQGKASANYHTKKDPQGPTQAQVKGQRRGGRPAKLETKTQRQASTLARHITRLNNGEGTVVSTFDSPNGLVQVYMLDSSAPRRAPSFYAVKRDGVTSPMDPTNENIPRMYRADDPNYDSDSDED